MHKIAHEDRDISWYRRWDKHLKKRARIRKAHLAFMNFRGFEPRPHQLLPVEIKETWLQKLWRRFKELFTKQPNYAAQH